MVWSEHDNPYGLYKNKAGEPTSYRFRHRRMHINTGKGSLDLPGWVVGQDALKKEAPCKGGVVVHLFAPRFIAYWTSFPYADAQFIKDDRLPVKLTLPIPLDEISEETLVDVAARDRWLDEAAAAVVCWRGDICELLPEDAPDYDEDDVGDGTHSLIPYQA